MRFGHHYIAPVWPRKRTRSVLACLTFMEETRIDRLESRFDELAAEMRSGFRAVDTRLCKIESRLDQTATKSDLDALRTEMYKNNAEMKTWLLGSVITIVALFCVAVFGLHNWNR